MKTKTMIIAGLVALSSTVIGRADTVVTNTADDLILGFAASSGAGSSLNLEVNLGNVGNFFTTAQGGSLTPGQVVNLSPKLALSDLSSTYTSSWQTNANLSWGVAGASNKGVGDVILGTTYKSTMWVTAATSTPGASTPWYTGTISAQNHAVGPALSIDGGLDGATAAGTSVSALVDATALTNWSVNALGAGGVVDYIAGSYGPTIVQGTSSTVAYADLYQLVPNTLTPKPAGKLLGWFSLYGDGSTQYLTFTAIPEPSTYAALLGAAALGFVMIRRRKQVLA